MRKGFTILELLVASLLLGMLVTILTQVFSQSSIAWSTGTAGVVELDAARRDMAALQVRADALLDRNGRSVRSVFTGLDGQLAQRAYAESGSIDEGASSSVAGSLTVDDPSSWSGISVGGATSASASGVITDGKGYAVGVRSAGPDRQFGTWDDITTWPSDGSED